MNDKYKTQDIILKSDYVMVTSKLVDDAITMYIYTNPFIDRERWILHHDFGVSQKEFSVFGGRINFLLAGYIREMCKMEAINDRIHG